MHKAEDAQRTQHHLTEEVEDLRVTPYRRTAPDALEWALGVDRDGRAWRRFEGDRYLR